MGAVCRKDPGNDGAKGKRQTRSATSPIGSHSAKEAIYSGTAVRGSVHRRIVSELDMNSMRRISDALLLAQNRARRATDRTNQSEQFV